MAESKVKATCTFFVDKIQQFFIIRAVKRFLHMIRQNALETIFEAAEQCDGNWIKTLLSETLARIVKCFSKAYDFVL